MQRFFSSCWLLLFLSKALVEGWINIATKSATESLLELVALSDCVGNHQHETSPDLFCKPATWLYNPMYTSCETSSQVCILSFSDLLYFCFIYINRNSTTLTPFYLPKTNTMLSFLLSSYHPFISTVKKLMGNQRKVTTVKICLSFLYNKK